MTVDTAQKRRSVLNMDMAGTTGPFPLNDISSEPARRHMVGLYRFEEETPTVSQPYRKKKFLDGDILISLG